MLFLPNASLESSQVQSHQYCGYTIRLWSKKEAVSSHSKIPKTSGQEPQGYTAKDLKEDLAEGGTDVSVFTDEIVTVNTFHRMLKHVKATQVLENCSMD